MPSPESSDEVVVLEISERIATITLNRPEARNALSSEVLRRLPLAMTEADGNEDVDVIILTGTDPAFSAGLDLKELGSATGGLGGRRDAGGSIESTGGGGAGDGGDADGGDTGSGSST